MDQLVLDTALLPVPGRFERWKLGIADYAVTPLEPARAFDGRSTVTGLGALLISESVLPPLHFARTEAMLRADGRDYWTLTLMLEGSFRGRADGRPMHVPAGLPCLLDASRPSDLLTTQGRSVVVVLPRNLLRERAPSTDAHGPLPQGAAARLLVDYLVALCAGLPDLDAAAALPAARALCELVAACLPVVDGATLMARQRGRALKARIIGVIEQRLHNRLDVRTLAAELGVSRSALYRAVDGMGGIAGLVRNCRLEAVHRALTDNTDKRPIYQIARACGFNEGAPFSRQFRAAFGYTAAELRRSAVVPSPLPEGSEDPALAFRNAVERLASGPNPG
jgi:AraC-like DNA-binding protein